MATSADYSQLINEPTHFVNKASSCIDLIFSSDLNITRNYGIEKVIHERCQHGIIYGTLNLNVPILPPYSKISGIIYMQILRIFKKLFQCLIGRKHLRIKIQTKIILHTTKKFDCKCPEWMNSFIISSMKKRTKYTKRFYKNPSDYNKDLLNNQANEFKKLIIHAKEKILPK